ncbi:predicted protein [Naegleria gruberi]|uniref:Tetratricopeptide repeat protein 29 n=1 Tax=Naegleria gruberi TaxID=5762 RepID=D2VG88_NAEGR|nr:uncharacterized protein NAEGRDRAFT_67893 [Naegleria gruberi]EFC44227.1 predicted protein [Naegleria gruberi]|eukprot:XP_002676971.1 predicted protein [Naegleria gruberi strain NEG-M]
MRQLASMPTSTEGSRAEQSNNGCTTWPSPDKKKKLSNTTTKNQLSASRLSSAMFRKSIFDSDEQKPQEGEFVTVDSLRKKLSLNLFSSEKKKKEEQEAGVSILRQSFNLIECNQSPSATFKPKTYNNCNAQIATSKFPSSESSYNPMETSRQTYRSSESGDKKLKSTKESIAMPPLQLGKTSREETDTFVRGFQYIEKLNKRAKSAGQQRSNLSTSRTSNSGFLSSRSYKSTIQSTRESKDGASQMATGENDFVWENYENLRGTPDLQHHTVKTSTLEPLRLQYDPSQIRMTPVSIVNTHGGSNSKKNMIKDLKMMAEACSRAGRLKMEGLIHYKIANKYEELQEDMSAVPHYERFLAISENLKDEMGQCLALNCLGVLYQKMGGTENLNIGLKYHMMQWDISDPQSQIVSNINMGLIFQQLGHFENASDNFKMAYQQSQKIGDKQGESIALANLGLLGKENGDLSIAQACMERHLTLSENLNNPVSEGEAYQHLGILASKKGDGDEAVKMLQKARNIAIQYDKKKADQIACNIGIIEGNNMFEQYMKRLYPETTTN